MQDILVKQIAYDIEVNVCTFNQRIDSDCNAITFINQGSNPVVIDLVDTLQAQAVRVIGGNLGEICRHKFQIRFLNEGGTNMLVIYRKVYTNQ